MSRVILASVLVVGGLFGAFYLFVHKEYRFDAVLIPAKVLIDGVHQAHLRVFRRENHGQLLVAVRHKMSYDVLVLDLPSGEAGWTVSSADSDLQRIGDRLVTSITGRRWKPFSIDAGGHAGLKILDASPTLINAKVHWPRAVDEPSREAILTIELK